MQVYTSAKNIQITTGPPQIKDSPNVKSIPLKSWEFFYYLANDVGSLLAEKVNIDLLRNYNEGVIKLERLFFEKIPGCQF